MTCSRTILDVSNFGNRLGNSKFCSRTPNPLTDSLRFEENVFGRHQQSKPIKCWRLSPRAISSVVLPLLPFNSSEVLVPSESKTLHLYEARYLALLEESLARNKLFVHFVLDPILISGNEASFAARYGCLVNIENVSF